MTLSSKKSIRRQSKLMHFIGLTGEMLITAGVIMGLFLAWYLVWNDTIQGQRQKESAITLSQEWRSDEPIQVESELAEPTVMPSDEEPPVMQSPASGDVFALLYVPRFGPEYVRKIAEGVDVETVLNSRTLGVGRYPQSNQLGEVGNFALAAHRNGWGASFGSIGELRIGDRIYVEVSKGWHSYAFRNLEYVWASEVQVLNSFPRLKVEATGSRVITLTSCHPKFSDAERIIAYGVYDGWYPRAGGPPTELAAIVKGGR
jgi:sortase A